MFTFVNIYFRLVEEVKICDLLNKMYKKKKYFRIFYVYISVLILSTKFSSQLNLHYRINFKYLQVCILLVLIISSIFYQIALVVENKLSHLSVDKNIKNMYSATYVFIFLTYKIYTKMTSAKLLSFYNY